MFTFILIFAHKLLKNVFIKVQEQKKKKKKKSFFKVWDEKEIHARFRNKNNFFFYI